MTDLVTRGNGVVSEATINTNHHIVRETLHDLLNSGQHKRGVTYNRDALESDRQSWLKNKSN